MQSTTKFLVIILVVAFLAIPQTVQAADPLALVTNVTISQTTVTISGTLPCSKWTAYTATQVSDSRIDITVYRKTKMPTASCGLSVKSYQVNVTPTLVAGMTYDVYVNGKYKGQMIGK